MIIVETEDASLVEALSRCMTTEPYENWVREDGRSLLARDLDDHYDQLCALDYQLNHMLSDEPLPLPGESELYDLFDMLQLR